MTEPARPITEDDLLAYVDELLDPARRAEIEHHLAAHPEAAQRVAADRAQRQVLREALAPHLADPVPAALNLERLLWSRLPSRHRIWQIAATVVLAFGLGGAGGWFLRASVTPVTAMASFADDAVASHLVYSADRRRPVELWAAERDDLTRWVSNRLNHPLAPPDLSSRGYKLMGGRLVATTHGPAALFMYNNEHGTRLSLFVRPMSGRRATPILQVDVGSIDGCAWVEKGLGYFVVAAEPYARLLELSEQAKSQLDSGT